VTLAIARKLKERIDREPNMRAVLTRDGDYFIPLQMRVHKARRINADLFVSVHADAFVNPTRVDLLCSRYPREVRHPPLRAGSRSARTTPT
jgi:N-acetylmuramoyl-L-alanine amidase